MRDPLVDSLLRRLLADWLDQARPRQYTLMHKTVQRQTKRCSAPGSGMRLKLGHHAVNAAGECAENPVNALGSGFLRGRRQVHVGGRRGLLNNQLRRRRLPQRARREELFSDDFGSGAGKAPGQTGKESLGKRDGTRQGIRC